MMCVHFLLLITRSVVATFGVAAVLAAGAPPVAAVPLPAAVDAAADPAPAALAAAAAFPPPEPPAPELDMMTTSLGTSFLSSWSLSSAALHGFTVNSFFFPAD